MRRLLLWPPWHGELQHQSFICSQEPFPWYRELHPQIVVTIKDASSPPRTSLTWWATPSNRYPKQGCFVPYLDFSEMVGYTCKALSWTNILFFKSLLSGILYYSNRILNTENGNLAWGYCSDEPDSIVLRSSGFICCKKHVEEFGILGQTCPHIQTLSKLSMMRIWKRRLLRWIQTVETWGFRG